MQVSFVFGLEVNWSLLQARQAERAEEEETRKAQIKRDLEELNALRRRRKDGIASDHSASDHSARSEEEEADFEKHSSFNRRAVQSESSDNSSDEDLCPVPPTIANKSERDLKKDGIKNISSSVFRRVESSSGSDLSSSDDDFDKPANAHVSPSKGRRQAEGVGGMQDRVTKRSSVAVQEEKSLLQQASKKAKPLSDVYNLTRASTQDVNTSHVSVKLQHEQSGKGSQQSSGSEEKSSGGQWNCEVCTYLNSKRATKCGMCGRYIFHLD